MCCLLPCSVCSKIMHPLVLKAAKRVVAFFTVEPLMLLYYVSTTISNIVTQNLMIYKMCWPDMQPPTMDEQCPDEQAAQSTVSGISTWKPFLQFVIPAIAVAFAGSWSDKSGRRRPLILVPMVGQIASDLCLALSVVFWHDWSPIYIAIAETVPAAIAGGRAVLGAGTVTYLSDVTSEEDRTSRMGVLMACIFVGSPVGSALAGISNRSLGFLGAYLLCASLNVLALIYATVRLHEPENLQHSDTGELRAVLKLLTSPRLLILIISTFCIIGPMQGEYSVQYLFVRYMFGWTEVDYSLYAAFKMVLIFAGSLLTVVILCQRLKLTDSMIGILSCSTQILASLMYLLVTKSWHMYLVPIAELLHGAAMAVQKSIGSKLVTPNYMGKLNALYCISEAIMPIAIVPLYNVVYQNTFTYFAAAFFLTSAILTSPALLMFIWFYVEYRRSRGNQLQEENGNQAAVESGSTQTSVTSLKVEVMSSPEALNINSNINGKAHKGLKTEITSGHVETSGFSIKEKDVKNELEDNEDKQGDVLQTDEYGRCKNSPMAVGCVDRDTEIKGTVSEENSALKLSELSTENKSSNKKCPGGNIALGDGEFPTAKNV